MSCTLLEGGEDGEDTAEQANSKQVSATLVVASRAESLVSHNTSNSLQGAQDVSDTQLCASDAALASVGVEIRDVGKRLDLALLSRPHVPPHCQHAMSVLCCKDKVMMSKTCL
ncbi:hypothetical protein BTVI_99239 [Pitangus sulphuratus]|nr:hypothetical protein BTVI_99239 [Pitangus sulphuratus]